MSNQDTNTTNKAINISYICLDASFIEAANTIDDVNKRWELTQEFFNIVVNKQEIKSKDPTIKAILTAFKVISDRRIKNYINGCKGAEHGIKGGRPRKDVVLYENEIIEKRPRGRPRKVYDEVIENDTNISLENTYVNNDLHKNVQQDTVIYDYVCDQPTISKKQTPLVNNKLDTMETTIKIFEEAHKLAKIDMPSRFFTKSQEMSDFVGKFESKFMKIEDNKVVLYINNIKLAYNDFVGLISNILKKQHTDKRQIQSFSYFYDREAVSDKHFHIIIDFYEAKHGKTISEVEDENFFSTNIKEFYVEDKDLHKINSGLHSLFKESSWIHQGYLTHENTLFYMGYHDGSHIFVTKYIVSFDIIKRNIEYILYDNLDNLVKKFKIKNTAKVNVLDIEDYRKKYGNLKSYTSISNDNKDKMFLRD